MAPGGNRLPLVAGLSATRTDPPTGSDCMSRIIDFHAHPGKVNRGYPPLTVDKLLRFVDQRDIEWSIILFLVHPQEDYQDTTKQALDDDARHPGRLIPFANIDPRRGPHDGSYDFYPVLKEYADLGCKGCGDFLCNPPTNDPRMKVDYRACGQLAPRCGARWRA